MTTRANPNAQVERQPRPAAPLPDTAPAPAPAPATSPPVEFRLAIESTKGTKSVVVTFVTSPDAPDGREVHRDLLALNSSAERRRYAREAADKIPGHTDETQGRVEARLHELARGLAERASQSCTGPDDGDPEEPRGVVELGEAALADTPDDIKEHARRLLRDPDLLDRISADIESLGVAGETLLATLLYLIGVSRLLPRPLAAIVQGLSSSGKSFVLDAVAGMFPDEAVIRATAMTPNALYYLPPGTLAHRLVVAGERSRKEDDDRAEATRALREMLSSGVLTKMMPAKTEEGKIVTELLTQQGPIAFVETTTLTEIFAEDANRCLLLQTDERDPQTATVLAAAAARYAGRSVPAGAADRIRAVHHALQRMLPLADVVIPFAGRVSALFDTTRVESRRSYPHLMHLVKAVTLLRHTQRDRDAEGRIVATPQDYADAHQLAEEAMGRAAGKMVSAAWRFWERLRPRYPSGTLFTSDDAMRGETTSRSNVYRWLNQLSDNRLIEQTQPQKGRIPAKWQVRQTVSPAPGSGVPARSGVAPTPAEVFAATSATGV